MMNCKKASKLLPLYISDDLDASDLKSVEAHINSCLQCYRDYQAHLKTYRNLKRLSEKPDLAPVLDGFTSEVMDRIAHDAGGPSASIPRVSYHIVPRSIAAAAMLFLVLAGYYFFIDTEQSTPHRREMLPSEVTPVREISFPPSIYRWKTDFSMQNGGSPEEKDSYIILAPEEESDLHKLHPQCFPKVLPVGTSRDL